jgi:RNA polymerase sigma-70 factor (sigma-E family)
MRVDWHALERDLADAVVEEVTRIASEYRAQGLVAAALHHVYADSRLIAMPLFAVATQADLQDPDMGRSPADWQNTADSWRKWTTDSSRGCPVRLDRARTGRTNGRAPGPVAIQTASRTLGHYRAPVLTLWMPEATLGGHLGVVKDVTGHDEPPPTRSARWEAPAEFDEFVRNRHAALLRFAHLLTGDAHAAADLVQEALEQAGLRWRSIRRQDAPESYVRRSILNSHINRGRRRRREYLVAAAPDRDEPDAQPRDEALWRLLATLAPQQRAVLVLRFYEDLTEVETARVLGCSVGTVKSTSSRALARLRAALPANNATFGGEA